MQLNKLIFIEKYNKKMYWQTILLEPWWLKNVL